MHSIYTCCDRDVTAAEYTSNLWRWVVDKMLMCGVSTFPPHLGPWSNLHWPCLSRFLLACYSSRVEHWYLRIGMLCIDCGRTVEIVDVWWIHHISMCRTVVVWWIQHTSTWHIVDGWWIHISMRGWYEEGLKFVDLPHIHNLACGVGVDPSHDPEEWNVCLTFIRTKSRTNKTMWS